MQEKFKVGVIGGTGYVGQRFITILDNHPWFEVNAIMASPKSAGKTYEEAVKGKWKIEEPIPENIKKLVVWSIEDIEEMCKLVDFVFCAVDMKKDEIRKLEERIAQTETPVISNNSAHRWTKDVPVIIPEINPEHSDIIDEQKKRLKTEKGFIVAKPNCSIQSYVPALHALKEFGIDLISVCTYQAISGAGKTFEDWPEMTSNVIPYIGGEEEKSEKEPLKIWGKVEDGEIKTASSPTISAQCYRVAVQEGHTAAVSVKFKNKPTVDQIITCWKNFKGEPQILNLPTAPEQFLNYMSEDNRPQAKLDCDFGNGMSVSIGRLRDDAIFDYKFTCLSHNTKRGAAGGAVLTAELLVSKGYITKK